MPSARYLTYLLPVFLLTASTAHASPTQQIIKALNSVTQKISSASSVQCTAQDFKTSYTCLQTFGQDGTHFAALGIEAKLALKPIKPGTVAVKNVSFGPGGGGAAYVGQTSDHAFDIIVTKTEILGQNDRSSLPSAPVLINRISAAYEKELNMSFEPQSIGVARQEPDGTIILTLRAGTGDGTAGDAEMYYKPADPKYEEIKRHLGPIPKGGYVPVKPFPKEKK